MGDEFMDGFLKMGEYAREHGLDALVNQIKAINTTDFAARRKAALFVVGMRDHGITPDDFKEQAFGIVAICRRCEMAIKIKRGAVGIDGRALDFACPSGRNITR